MDRSTITWYDHMRRTLGLLDFFMPYTGRLGASQAIKELESVALMHWREHKPGAIQLFGFTSLVDGVILGGELDPLHGDVEQALADLDEGGPQHDLVQSIRETASWRCYYDVARGALEAFEHIDGYLGGGVGSPQRNEIVCARLEAEGLARHADGIEGARFLYGFGRLFESLKDWQNRVHVEMMKRQREDRRRQLERSKHEQPTG